MHNQLYTRSLLSNRGGYFATHNHLKILFILLLTTVTSVPYAAADDDNNARNLSGVVSIEKHNDTCSALSVYDPEANGMQMDADKLSRRIFTWLRDSTGGDSTVSPLPEQDFVLTRRTEDGGLSFMVDNPLDHPIYFNVFKISGANGTITISELGQPVGCYVIRPTQFLAREQSVGSGAEELHFMAITDFYFDIDEVLSILNNLFDSDIEIESDPEIALRILPM